MKFRIESEREDDGRWLAEVTEFPGVLAYGTTHDIAIAHVKALAIRVIADRIENDDDISQVTERSGLQPMT